MIRSNNRTSELDIHAVRVLKIVMQMKSSCSKQEKARGCFECIPVCLIDRKLAYMIYHKRHGFEVLSNAFFLHSIFFFFCNAVITILHNIVDFAMIY